LATAMIKLQRDPALCDRLGRRANLYVDDEHTWERYVQRNLDAYRVARGEKSSGTGACTEADAARK
jgi:glycosyltransferase involved in cell wall biosynthesis